MTQRRGARWSCADAYLKPVLYRRNLQLLTNATVRRCSSAAAGPSAWSSTTPTDAGRPSGPPAKSSSQRRRRQHPQLLMLSGIGDAAGFRVRHRRRPACARVGKNLLDHLIAPLGFAVRDDSLFDAEKPAELANYLLRRRGHAYLQRRGGLRLRPQPAGTGMADLEADLGTGPFYDEGIGEAFGHGIATGPVLLKPRSTGTVTLRSADPAAKPVIDRAISPTRRRRPRRHDRGPG